MTATTIAMTNEQLQANVATVTMVSTDNYSDITARLIKTYRKKVKIGTLLTLIITIVSIAVTSVCFVFVKQNGTKNESINVPLVFGIIGAIHSIAFLITFGILCYSLRDGLDWMNKVLQMIQLNGNAWQNQLNSIQSTVPRKETNVLCQGNRYDRLRMHPTGHIVLAEDGIIIDELFAIRYDVYIVFRVELANSIEVTGSLLRLFLVTRWNSLDKGIDKGKQIAFEVYLFMPAYMQIQELTDIRQSILSNSQRCLTAAGFYKNPRVVQQLNAFNQSMNP